MARTGDKISRLRDFLRDERGVLTVESVLWLPFYLIFIAMIADVSMMFHAASKAQRIAQDLNRLAVLTWVEDPNVAVSDCASDNNKYEHMQCRANNIVHSFSPNATVTISYKSDRVQTFIKMPSRDVLPVGLLSAFRTFDITASAAHIREL